MPVTLENIDLDQPNTGNGDPLRNGGEKINNNHNKLFVLARVIQAGTMQYFKKPGNEDINSLEPGDIVRGWWNATLFIQSAVYNAGNIGDIGSYTIIDSTPFE